MAENRASWQGPAHKKTPLPWESGVLFDHDM